MPKPLTNLKLDEEQTRLIRDALKMFGYHLECEIREGQFESFPEAEDASKMCSQLLRNIEKALGKDVKPTVS